MSPAAHSCAECHIDIADQWEKSAHAAAWTDGEFVEGTKGHFSESCLPCHASKPMLEQASGDLPLLRQSRRADGVDCHACHAVGCDYAGPYDGWGPHGTQNHGSRLRDSAFCGSCHVMEYEQYKKHYLQSQEKPAECIDCHMPAYRSRLTQGHVLSLIHPQRTVRNHEFPAWPAGRTQRAIEVGQMAIAEAGSHSYQISFTLTNRGAGHRIPTGKFGHREVRVAVELLGGDGAVEGQAEESIKSLTGGLVPGRATPFVINVDVGAKGKPAELRLLIERVNEDRSFRLGLVDRRWPLEYAR